MWRFARHLDLALCILATLLVASFAVALPAWQSPMRALLALPVLLIAPGYALQALLFPNRKDTRAVERIALAVGLSAATLPLLGLALEYLPWGLRPVPVALGLTATVLAAAVGAGYRRKLLPTDSAFVPSVRTPGFLTSLVIGAFAVACIGLVVAAVGWLRPNIGFTEFYLVNDHGRLVDDPMRLEPGSSFAVTLGVASREFERARYKIHFGFGENPSIDVGWLEPNEVWEHDVELSAPIRSGCASLRFELERAGEASPYRSLRWVVPVYGAGADPRDGANRCP